MQVKLHEGQLQVASDNHRFRVICAGRRWGKSVLSQLVVLQWATRNVGTYWIVSPTYRQGKQIHWRGLQQIIPREWVAKKNEVELSITLKNGSIIELKGAENPDALRGVKLRGLVVDEIASIRNWEWLWQEVLRPTLTDYEAPSLFISTPKGYNHFFELYQSGQNSDEGSAYKSWRFTSYDNPYIKKEEIDNAKKELTEDTFYQEYMADFRKYTGLVYKEFQREVHVVEPFTVPDGWTRYRAIDFGSTNPTACLWIAIDGDNNWYIENEHYQTGQTIDYHAGLINSISANKSITATYGDPSGAQWINEFAQRGIYITPANKETGTNFNSWVRFGIEKVAERLKRTPGRMVSIPQSESHFAIDGGMPSLFIFKSCTQTIRELETYRWKEKSVTQAQDLNEPDVPEKANDHCFTGDTMILTKTGWKRIDKIKKSEYVWSPFGWNEVYRAGSTGIKKVKDYGVFKCTPDHKIFTNRGLVEVDKLRYSDKILIWLKSRRWFFREFLTGVIQMPKIELIGFIFNALLIKSLMARQDFYTEIYGNSIKVKFLMVIWFIILMGILSITTLVTLSLSLLVNTLKNIIGVFGMVLRNILIKFGHLPNPGTSQRLVENGILELLKIRGMKGKWLLWSVIFVEGLIKRPFLVEANTVIRTARRQHLEEKKVYNLATRFGMYFANGILVSNSMDALRYFAVSYKKAEKPFKPPVNDISLRNWSLK